MGKSTDTPEWILLSEDRQELNDIVRHINREVLPNARKVKAEAEKLQIVFDQSAWESIRTAGFQWVQQYLTKRQISELDRLQIHDQMIRENMVSGVASRLQPIKEAIAALTASLKRSGTTKTYPVIDLKVISIVDGVPVLSALDEEAILEACCRTYLKTAEEISLYKKLETFKEAYNAVNAMLKEYGQAGLVLTQNLAPMLTSDEYRGEVSVRPEAVASILDYCRIKQQYSTFRA